MGTSQRFRPDQAEDAPVGGLFLWRSSARTMGNSCSTTARSAALRGRSGVFARLTAATISAAWAAESRPALVSRWASCLRPFDAVGGGQLAN